MWLVTICGSFISVTFPTKQETKQKKSKKLRVQTIFLLFLLNFHFVLLLSPSILLWLSWKNYKPKLAYYTLVMKFFSACFLSAKWGEKSVGYQASFYVYGRCLNFLNQSDTKQAFMYTAGVWISSCCNSPVRFAFLLR